VTGIADARQAPVAQDVALVGTSLVEAGAGTGKTHTIVDLYERLLLERELSVSQILVVTYTVAATAELRDRIRRRLAAGAEREGELAERYRQAIRDFDRAAIVSIHGFCQRALRQHAFESGSGFESELLADGSALLEEVAQDFWSERLHDAPRYQIAYAEHVGLLPSRLTELAARLGARPDARLLPARPEPPDLDRPLAELRDAHARAAAMWRSCGDEVIDLLEDAAEREILYKSSYKQPTIRNVWRIAMHELMLRDEPGLQRRFAQLVRLSRSGLLVKKGFAPPDHPFFDVCDDLVRADDRLDAALADWAAGLMHDFADYARRELLRRKQQRDVLFFDDLLQDLRDALAADGGEALAAALRSRHPVALIDEFQDTDPIQYEIFRRVWHEAPEDCEPAVALMLIGDPKQAIYAFRGADVLAYLEARGDAGEQVHGLRRNYRADPGLVAALNAFFGSREAPFARPEISYEPVDPKTEARDVLRGPRIATGLRFLLADPNEVDESVTSGREGGPLVRAVAAEVARILAEPHEKGGERLAAGDLAVLTRTNRQARGVQTALREHGVVSVLQSEESVFATVEARDFERVMRAVAEPERPARLKAAVATPLLGGFAEDLQKLEGDESGAGWDDWTLRLRAARQVWAERGFLQAFRYLWVESQAGPRLLARPGGERRVTNWLHVAELLQQASLEERLGPQALLYWLGRRRLEAEQSTSALAEDAQLRLESDARAVQLLTVHRSKGLEFPVTICPFLWDGLRVHSGEVAWRSHDPLTRDLVLEFTGFSRTESDGDRRKRRQPAEREAHEENLRLLYVALTRAKHHCSVVWGAFKGAEHSPLAHFVNAKGPDKLKDWTPRHVRAGLDAIAARAPEHIRVEPWSLLPSDVPRPAPELSEVPAGPLSARHAKRRYGVGWRVSSFSGPVAGAPSAGAPALFDRLDAAAEEGRDYDRVDGDAEAPERRPGGVRLADFPAGAMPGILIHEIFERIDFVPAADPHGPALGPVVARQLDRRGFEPHWQPALEGAVRDVLAVPLVPGDPESRLARVPRSDRVDEMEFVLPVATRAEGATPLTAAALGRAFAEHAVAPGVRDYAERAASLGFPALSGSLRGFIDLVFRRGERWSIVDYKSNRLGAEREDYAPEALEDAMREHDYVLQYHLYLVALHRHLAVRLPGYDYDRHVEGAFYLFVRGMSPAHPPGWGVFRDRPPRALIEALSECLS